MIVKNWINYLYILGVLILVSDIFLGNKLKNREVITITGFLVLAITVVIQYSDKQKNNTKQQ